MREDGGEKAGWMAEAEDGQFVWRESLDDVVDGDVRGTADEDTEISAEELED